MFLSHTTCFRVCDKFVSGLAFFDGFGHILDACRQPEERRSMGNTIESLLGKREEILREISGLGEFRRGTVSASYRKCGKPGCRCAREGEEGHGPRYLWNGTTGGKSFAKNLHLGEEVEKYVQETERYRRFIGLCEKLVEVNEKICDATPVREVQDKQELDELKKKLQRRLLRKRGAR